jgi:hypothetical protein
VGGALSEFDPQVEIKELGTFNVLLISQAEASISLVLLDDEPLVPIVQPSRKGATSLWRAPVQRTGELYVRGIDRKGSIQDWLVQLEGEEHTVTSRVRLELEATAPAGADPWGTYVQPILRQVWRSTGAKRGPLEGLSGISLVIHRRGRQRIVRRLLDLDGTIAGAVKMVHETALAAERDWAERRIEDVRLPEDELFKAFADPQSGLAHIAEEGLRLLWQELTGVLLEGGEALGTISIRHGERFGADAEAAWDLAVPQLVAMRLSPEAIDAAGLGPAFSTQRFGSLVLSDEDQLTIENVPAGVALDVVLPSGPLLPAVRARMEVLNGTLVWSRQREAAAEAALASLVAAYTTDPIADFEAELLRAGRPLPPTFRQDAALLLEAVEAPAWLAAAAAPAEAAFSGLPAGGGLGSPTFWEQPGLPLLITQRTLSHWLHLTALQPGSSPAPARALGVDADTPAYETLLEIDGELQPDQRYAGAARGLTSAAHIEASPDVDGRRAALLLGIAGHQEEGDAFINALEAGRSEVAFEIASRLLALNTPTLVRN